MSQSCSDRWVQLSTTTRVPAGARVRHFDELSDWAQDCVARHVAGGSVACAVPDLRDGDVVVYTDYVSVSTT